MKKGAHITSSIKKSNKGEAVSQEREERKEPLKTSRSRGLFSSDHQNGRSAKKSQQRVVCVCVCWLSFSLLDCKHSENRNYLFLPVLPTVFHSAPWMWEMLNKCLLEKESKEGRGGRKKGREGRERERNQETSQWKIKPCLYQLCNSLQILCWQASPCSGVFTLRLASQRSSPLTKHTSVSSSWPSDPLSQSHLTPNCGALELEKLKLWISREYKISESNSFI